MRCFGLWVVTAGLVVLPVVQAQERPVEGWGVATDPDNDCKIKAQKGRLTMNLPGTAHDFAAELKRWNAPRVLSKVEGDFHLEVKVAGGFNPTADSSIPGRRGYNGGGLLVVKDADNYVSLHRGAVNLDGRVRHYANFELRKNGEMDISLYEVELEDKDTYLRLERRGDKVYGLATHDRVTWKNYDPIEVDFPAPLLVGVVGINSSKEPFACAFSELGLFKKVGVKLP